MNFKGYHYAVPVAGCFKRCNCDLLATYRATQIFFDDCSKYRVHTIINHSVYTVVYLLQRVKDKELKAQTILTLQMMHRQVLEDCEV